MQDSKLPNKQNGNNVEEPKLQAEYQDEDLILLEDAKWDLGEEGSRTQYNFFVLCNAGSLSLSINDIPLKLRHATLLRCPTGVVLSDIVPSADFRYTALALTNRALQSYLRANINKWNLVIYKYKMYTTGISENDYALLRKFHELLHYSLDRKTVNDDPAFRRSIIRGLVETELNAFCSKIDVNEEEKESNPHSLGLFNQFLNKLQQGKVKRRTVEQYAAELCVSSKYLSDICKRHSGKTAKQWIQEHTVAEITYYLRYTSLSIKEISIILGFPNCSFFCKYVREHLHCSPTEYRQKNKG